MLRHRLISAFILIGTLLMFLWLDASQYNFGCPGLWLLPIGVYLIFGSAVECATMVGRSQTGSIAAPGLIGCACIMIAASIALLAPESASASQAHFTAANLAWPLVAAAFALIGCFAWYLFQYEAGHGIFQRAILAGWVACYFGLGFTFAIAVRRFQTPQYGLFLLGGIILVTKLADTGAYFTGRSLGRTKLCPNVSPNKTVEGLVGGCVLACLAAWVYFGPTATWLFAQQQTNVGFYGAVGFGIGMTFAGLIGDLLESAFKRESGCKDSGKLLPGLGGLWDVTDSLLPSMAVGYALLKVGIV